MEFRTTKFIQPIKHKHTVLKIILSIIVILLCVVGVISYQVYKNVDNAFSNSYVTIEKTTPVDFKKNKPFTTLLIESGTSGSKKIAYGVVLASVNPKTNQTTLMNFPVFATMPNKKSISEVYNKEGNDGIFNMVTDLLDIKINKVVQINVNNVGNIVQATGGINMQNYRAFNSNGYQFPQGTINFTTKDQISAYTNQLNSKDLNNSISRIQDVSMELYGNIKDVASVNKLHGIGYYNNLIQAFSETMKTNINFKDAKTIVLKYNKALLNTRKLNLHKQTFGTQEFITKDELNKVKEMFLNSLN